jgi:hypothetical protein
MGEDMKTYKPPPPDYKPPPEYKPPPRV